jgi:prephenate dehydrogenase
MPRTLPVVQSGPAAAAAPPPFDRIGIVGLGLVGGSIAMAARRLWPRALVVGVDRNEVLETAQRLHAIDVAADDLGMLREVQLVVLAAPVVENIQLVGSLAEAVDGEAVVTDVGSTKQAIVAAARTLPPRLVFVGGHPLAGAARGGIAHASPALFEGRPWILTPREDAGDLEAAALARVETFVRALGARPVAMSAADHDRLVAWISHLPQLAASALMAVIGDAVPEGGLGLAGRGLRDTTRLASSPAGVWADICRTNDAYIREALDALIALLGELRQGLADPAAIERIFERANRWRARLDATPPAAGARDREPEAWP